MPVEPPQTHRFEHTRRTAIVRRVADVLHARDAIGVAHVLDKASVTKQEVTALFGDADGLIAAVVALLADEVLVPLADGGDQALFRPHLAEFGRRLAKEYRGQRFKHLYRFAVNASEAKALKADFYRCGPGHVQDGLARYFECARLHGGGHAPDGRQMAAHFLSLLRAYWTIADAFPANDPPEVESDIPLLVDTFLSGIATGTQHA